MNRFRMAVATLGLVTAILVPSMRAGETDKETRMTINGPLQVQDTLLAPGQYVFRLTEPDISHSVVSIFSADGTRLEGIVIGWSTYRADAGDEKMFTISQPQGDQPAKLQTWFYPGDNSGVEFSVKPLASETRHVVKSKQKGQAADAAGNSSSTHN